MESGTKGGSFPVSNPNHASVPNRGMTSMERRSNPEKTFDRNLGVAPRVLGIGAQRSLPSRLALDPARFDRNGRKRISEISRCHHVSQPVRHGRDALVSCRSHPSDRVCDGSCQARKRSRRCEGEEESIRCIREKNVRIREELGASTTVSRTRVKRKKCVERDLGCSRRNFPSRPEGGSMRNA